LELENTGYYVSLHSFFQNTAIDMYGDLLDLITGIYNKGIYTVHRNVVAMNIKIGYRCIKKSGFTIDTL